MAPPHPQIETDRSNNNPVIFASVTSILLVFILIYPWIFGLSCLSFFIGYYLLDNISEYIHKLIFKNVQISQSSTEVYKLDPLLHPEPLERKLSSTSHRHSLSSIEENHDSKHPGGSGTCPVCDAENCPRSTSNGNESRTAYTTHYGRGSHDLRIDPALDKCLAKFCSTIFDFYINSEWAPYETRKQLKLAFKALLTNFGESLQSNLAEDGKAITFCEEKIIPLCFHYLERIWSNYSNQRSSLKSPLNINLKDRCDLEKNANLKLRRLCRKLLEKNLPSQDQKCLLWIELCVAVLGDGVLWNLILLARRKLPKLLHEYCQSYKSVIELSASTIEPWTWPPDQNTVNILSTRASVFMKSALQSVLGSSQWFRNFSEKLNLESNVPEINRLSSEIENRVHVTSNSAKGETHQVIFTIGNNGNGSGSTLLVNKVPLLLDSFLDPVHDLDQPDFISSRWRPTLDEILAERDLLYCLIQYLKGHKALEYLQAVLDETPDGNVYCKKVLQLEYLPGFCRSKFFMESLGISQVDCALEAGNDSPNSRRKLGHTRSSSYGNVNSGMQFWKIADPKAVDGLPLHTSSLGSVVSSGAIESDFAFRRRQYSTEGIISKFIVSTGGVNDTSKKDYNFPKGGSIPPTRRIGIHAKSYEDLAAENVLNEVLLGPCDIYDCATQIVVSSLSRQMWIQPVLSGWTQLLRPYLKPYFDQHLKSQLNNHLTIGTCVYLIDLITQAFVANSSSNISETLDPSETSASSTVPGIETIEKTTKVESEQKEEDPDHHRATRQNLENENIAKIETSILNLGHWLLGQFVDPIDFALALQSNEDEIILFFIDLVDLIVKQVVEED